MLHDKESQVCLKFNQTCSVEVGWQERGTETTITALLKHEWQEQMRQCGQQPMVTIGYQTEGGASEDSDREMQFLTTKSLRVLVSGAWWGGSTKVPKHLPASRVQSLTSALTKCQGLAELCHCLTPEDQQAHSPQEPIQTAEGLHISSDSHLTGGSPGTQPSEQSSVPSIHFMVRILAP